MIGKIKIIILFFLFCALNAFAQEEVQLSLSNKEVVLNDVFQLIVSFNNLRAIDNINIKNLNSFDVIGKSQSTSTSFINGNISSSIKYIYELSAKKEGKYEIGPVVVKSNNKEYISNIVNIEVVNKKVDDNNLNTNNDNNNLKKLFIKIEPNKKALFLNDILELKYKIYYLEDEVSNIELQKFDINNFVAIDNNKEKEKKYKEKFNDNVYAVIEVTKKFKSVKIGKYPVPEMILNVFTNVNDNLFINPFMRGKKEIVRSEFLEIDVRELPTPIPVDFSGVMGKVVVESKISSQEVNAGENINLELILKSDSDLSTINPELNVNKDIKIYAEKAKIDETNDMKVKILKFAIVPNKEGKYKLNFNTSSIFNIEVNNYETLILPTFDIVVHGNINTDNIEHKNNNIKKSKLDNYKTDIFPLVEDIEQLEKNQLLNIRMVILYFILYLTLLILAILLHFNLLNKFKKKDIMKLSYINLKQGYVTNALDIDIKIKNFLSAILKNDYSTCTVYEIEKTLNKLKVNDNIINLIAILKELEVLNYSGIKISSGNLKDLWMKTFNITEKIYRKV